MNLVVMTQATQLLAEYSADHQNPFNRLMHSICVPLIAIALIGLLWVLAKLYTAFGIRPV